MRERKAPWDRQPSWKTSFHWHFNFFTPIKTAEHAGEKDFIDICFFASIAIYVSLMATSVTTRHISVASSAASNRSLTRPNLASESKHPSCSVYHLSLLVEDFHSGNLNPESISSGSVAPAGVPVKFGDHLFSLVSRPSWRSTALFQCYSIHF